MFEFLILMELSIPIKTLQFNGTFASEEVILRGNELSVIIDFFVPQEIVSQEIKRVHPPQANTSSTTNFKAIALNASVTISSGRSKTIKAISKSAPREESFGDIEMKMLYTPTTKSKTIEVPHWNWIFERASAVASSPNIILRKNKSASLISNFFLSWKGFLLETITY